jgi:hypothetical protein
VQGLPDPGGNRVIIDIAGENRLDRNGEPVAGVRATGISIPASPAKGAQ